MYLASRNVLNTLASEGMLPRALCLDSKRPFPAQKGHGIIAFARFGQIQTLRLRGVLQREGIVHSRNWHKV
jgi:hypothetical protein